MLNFLVSPITSVNNMSEIFNEKKTNNNFKLSINGNINILNDKINLKKIIMNETYKASKEDLKYFEGKFEEIMFDESFIKIFNLKKIKRFIMEMS